MKRTTITIASLIFLVAIPWAIAQSGMQGGRGLGARNYNPATETTLKGTVEDVMQTTGNRGGIGTHLSLKTDQGVYDVHVGPAAYVSAQQFAFAKGDALEVIGSKANVNGKDILIARQIKKGNGTLTLRDERGFPKWSRAAAPPK